MKVKVMKHDNNDDKAVGSFIKQHLGEGENINDLKDIIENVIDELTRAKERIAELGDIQNEEYITDDDMLIYDIDNTLDELTSFSELHFSKIREREDKAIKYVEIEMGHIGHNEDDTYSLCIKALDIPTLEEAMEFCKYELTFLGYETITDIREISKEEAYMYFDMEKEKEFPIFSKAK